jgi:general secretion pathway protein G
MRPSEVSTPFGLSPSTPLRTSLSKSGRPSTGSGRGDFKHIQAGSISGFTLIELVVTVAIVGILASMVVPLMEMTAKRERETELRTDLREIRGAIDAYHQAVLDKRVESPADASGYPPSLDKLVTGVPDITKPDRALIYFLRRLPRDPMNPDSSLTAAQSWGKRSYASPYDAPMEGEDVFDVYSRSEAAGLNGVPYREW